ncbi:unnamed protein product [Chrysoparadoxa australica]
MVGKVEIDELAAVDLNGMESTFPTCSVEPGTEIMFDMMVDAAFPASMMGAGDSIIGDTDIVKPTAIAFDRNNNLWIAVSVLDDPAADTHKAPTLYLLKSNTDGGDLEIVGPVFIGDQKNAQMIGLGDTFFSGDSFSSLCMGGQGFLAFEVGGMEFDCGDDLWLGTAPQPQVVCMDGMAVGGTPLTNLFSITHYYEGSTFLAEEGGLDSFAVAGRISANGILAQISDNDLDRARRTSASIIETSNEVEADIFSILSDRGVGGNTKGFKGLTGLSQNRGDGGDQCKCPYVIHKPNYLTSNLTPLISRWFHLTASLATARFVYFNHHYQSLFIGHVPTLACYSLSLRPYSLTACCFLIISLL